MLNVLHSNACEVFIFNDSTETLLISYTKFTGTHQSKFGVVVVSDVSTIYSALDDLRHAIEMLSLWVKNHLNDSFDVYSIVMDRRQEVRKESTIIIWFGFRVQQYYRHEKLVQEAKRMSKSHESHRTFTVWVYRLSRTITNEFLIDWEELNEDNTGKHYEKWKR